MPLGSGLIVSEPGFHPAGQTEKNPQVLYLK